MVDLTLTIGLEIALASIIVVGILYYCWIVHITKEGGVLSRAASYSGYGKPVARRASSIRSDDSTCAEGLERDSLAIRMTVDMDDYEYRDSCGSPAATLMIARPRNSSL